MDRKTRSCSCSISSVLKKQRTCQLETTVCALWSRVQCKSTPAVVLPLRPFKLNGPFTQKARSPRDSLNAVRSGKLFFLYIYCTFADDNPCPTVYTCTYTFGYTNGYVTVKFQGGREIPGTPSIFIPVRVH